jgi:hypothetical protein
MAGIVAGGTDWDDSDRSRAVVHRKRLGGAVSARGAAIAPALIPVGLAMMAPVAELEWEVQLAAVPSFLTLAGIPLTFQSC